MDDMPYTKPAFLVTVIAAVLSLCLAVGGSVFVSLSVAHTTKEQICGGFSYFIHKPTAPKGSVLYRREALQYRNLQIFKNKIGC